METEDQGRAAKIPRVSEERGSSVGREDKQKVLRVSDDLVSGLSVSDHDGPDAVRTFIGRLKHVQKEIKSGRFRRTSSHGSLEAADELPQTTLEAAESHLASIGRS